MIFYIPFFLCWGSFLNVVAYRLIKNKSIITPRSSCTHCSTMIAWYDNVPIISWCLLKGRCRSCQKPISFLYPFIEFTTTILLCYLYLFVPLHYFFGYFVFLSALIVTIRSDIETMLISQYMTIYLAPIAFFLSAAEMLPLTLAESIVGAIAGYFFLWSVNSIFKYLKGHDGIGEGDFDLLFLIGAFTGAIGCWASITIGSAIGSVVGLLSIIFSRYYNPTNPINRSTQIPFGPFLSLGAIIYIFLQNCL